MSIDAQEAPIHEDIQDAPEVETQSSASTEVDTEGTEESQEEKPFRAWELPKPEPKRSTHVPYERFRDVNERYRSADERARDLEQKNTELQAKIDELSKVPDPDDIDPNDYTDPREYLKVRDKAIAVKLRAEIAQDLAQREQVQVQTQQLQELGRRADAALAEQAKEDPNVTAAFHWFDENADAIDPYVGRELLADPNVGHVMVRIATDKQLLQRFFRAEPGDQIKLINRISARIEAERELRPAADVDGTPTIPARRRPAPLEIADPRASLRAGLPTQVKPRTAAGVAGGMTAEKLYSLAGKIPTSEYAKYKAELGL